MAQNPLDAFIEGQQVVRQRGQQELAQAQGLMGILAAVKKQEQEQAYRGALAGLGDNPDPQKLMGVVRQHAPVGVLAELIQNQMKQPEGQPIGSGGLRLRDGTVIAPAARPTTPEQWSEPYQMGGAMVQKNLVTGQVRQSVSREPQVRVTNEAPVTPVTIQAPDDPNGTIIVDGRTGRVLGKGPKLTETGKANFKQMTTMQGIGSDLQQAEDLLLGQVRDSEGNVTKGNLPTGSGVGSVVDTVAGWVGASPSGAAEADSLKVVAGKLIQKVPRFEGPQSDRDVALYKSMAADAGNEKIPRERRVKAVQKMREIYNGYENGSRGRLVQDQLSGGGAPGGVDRRKQSGATIRFDAQGNPIP